MPNLAKLSLHPSRGSVVGNKVALDAGKNEAAATRAWQESEIVGRVPLAVDCLQVLQQLNGDRVLPPSEVPNL